MEKRLITYIIEIPKARLEKEEKKRVDSNEKEKKVIFSHGAPLQMAREA